MFQNKKIKILQERQDLLTSRVDQLTRTLLNLLEQKEKKQQQLSEEIDRLKKCLNAKKT